MADYTVTRTKSMRSRNDQDGAVARQKLWSTPRSGSLNTYQSAYTPTGLGAIMLKQKLKKQQSYTPQYNVGDEYQKALDAANARNEARDKEIRQGYQDREAKAEELIAGQGALQKKDLLESYRQQGAAQNARLTGLGLGNTSVVGAMQQGLLRRQGDAMTGLNESLDRNRLNVLGGMAGDRLAYMERPNDIAPDLNQMLTVAQLQGKMGGGYGGYSGGNTLPQAYGAAPIFAGTYGMTNSMPYSTGGTSGGAQRQATSQMNRWLANANRQLGQTQYGNYQQPSTYQYSPTNLGATTQYDYPVA